MRGAPCIREWGRLHSLYDVRYAKGGVGGTVYQSGDRVQTGEVLTGYAQGTKHTLPKNIIYEVRSTYCRGRLRREPTSGWFSQDRWAGIALREECARKCICVVSRFYVYTPVKRFDGHIDRPKTCPNAHKPSYPPLLRVGVDHSVGFIV